MGGLGNCAAAIISDVSGQRHVSFLGSRRDFIFGEGGGTRTYLRTCIRWWHRGYWRGSGDCPDCSRPSRRPGMLARTSVLTSPRFGVVAAADPVAGAEDDAA